MRKARGKYTGEKIKARKAKQEKRQKHIQAIYDGSIEEELPEPLLPEVFKGIEELYWDKLKAVPDPRDPKNRVYPLFLILHRIIAGFIDGNKYIGVLFPKKRRYIESGKRKLGALPTRKAVYTLLRRIDWTEANQILAPLWDILGFTPDLIVRRNFRNPKEVLDEFKEEQKKKEQVKLQELAAKRENEEKSKGMSAAKAKRSKRQAPEPVAQDASTQSDIQEKQLPIQPIGIQHDLVIDGKVVKASYNSGVQERFVHVTEVRLDENDNRHRFIIGARPTELDRNGEWGAAVSILDALTPLPDDKVVIVSGDAGFNVEGFCAWLEENGFFLPFPNKRKRR
jgi:hypothetical protein